MTRKIVYNACYGGFGLSKKAVLRYAELKGFTVYPKVIRGLIYYYTVPESEQIDFEANSNRWNELTMEERLANNKAFEEQIFEPDHVERDDEILVQVVEELGEEANGDYARLEIVEIPSDVSWEIEEYEGNETVEEAHRSWG